MGVQVALPAGGPPQLAQGQIEFSLASAQGRFDFVDFEIPEVITGLGGEVVSAKHRFPGGKQIIQTFGAVPTSAISWNGRFLGAGVFHRIQTLDAMRRAQLECVLTYGQFKFNGIIKSFLPRPGHEGDVSYSLTFEPSTDVSAQVQTPAALASLNTSLTQTLNSLSQSAAIFSSSGNPFLSASSAELAVNIIALQQTIQSLGSGFVTELNALTLAPFATVFGLLAGQLLTFAQADSPLGDGIGPAVAASADALSALTLFVQVQQTVNLLASVNNAVALNYFTVVVNNPSLLTLAAKYYGDSGQWQVISNANNGFPIFAVGVYSLVIPKGAS
jgi:hypothetical protein